MPEMLSHSGISEVGERPARCLKRRQRGDTQMVESLEPSQQWCEGWAVIEWTHPVAVAGKATFIGQRLNGALRRRFFLDSLPFSCDTSLP
jgi:hypothetical protein